MKPRAGLPHGRAAEPWVDISVPLQTGLVRWPGDPPFKIRRIADLARGDACNVSVLSLPAHLGTHLDAPLHFLANGPAIDRLPLDATLGPARVVNIRSRTAVSVEELRGHRIRRGERLLLRTRNSGRAWWRQRFRRDFVHVTRDAAGYLAERRVRCLGIDCLSVGAPTPEGEEVHRILLGAGIWIIEGLDLSKVMPGRYRLICLPLRLVGGDGAPARAVLRRR